MPEPTDGLTARAVWDMQQSGHDRKYVQHYTKSTPFTVADLEELALALLDLWTQSMRHTKVNTVTLQSLTVTSLRGGDSEQHVLPCIANCVGTRATNGEPGNVTQTISWRTRNIGRRARGRQYLVGMAEADTGDDDLINSTKMALVLQLASSFLFGFLPAGMRLAILSKVDAVPREVRAYVLENIVDSMRRRLRGRGN